MRSIFTLLLLLAGSAIVSAQYQVKDSLYMREHYEKFEYQVPMRDGIRLFLVIYLSLIHI